MATAPCRVAWHGRAIRPWRLDRRPLRGVRTHVLLPALQIQVTAARAAPRAHRQGTAGDRGRRRRRDPQRSQPCSAPKIAETWRLYGLVVFTGLFALLALRPLQYRGAWELVLFNKLALTVTALAYTAYGGISGTAGIVVWDGGLSLLLIAAYICCRGWTAGPRLIRVPPMTAGPQHARSAHGQRRRRSPVSRRLVTQGPVTSRRTVCNGLAQWTLRQTPRSGPRSDLHAAFTTAPSERRLRAL